MDEWEATQHTDPKDSPFDVVEERMSLTGHIFLSFTEGSLILGHTVKDVQLRLAEKDKIFTVDGKTEIQSKHTSSSFISMAIELEDLLCVCFHIYLAEH